MLWRILDWQKNLTQGYIHIDVLYNYVQNRKKIIGTIMYCIFVQIFDDATKAC